MEFSRVLNVCSLLCFLMLSEVLAQNPSRNCTGILNDTSVGHTHQDNGCNIRQLNSQDTFFLNPGQNVYLKCRIPTKDIGNRNYWTKDGVQIAEGKIAAATSGKYVFSYLAERGYCNETVYSVGFTAGQGYAGYYACGCNYGSNTSEVGFRVFVDLNAGTNLVGGIITTLTFVIIGIFHLASIIALIVIGCQIKNGCPGGRVCKPGRLLAVIIGEVVCVIAVPAVLILQIVKIIPKCCEGDLFLRMIGIGVVLCCIGVILIIITIAVYRKVKGRAAKAKRRSNTAGATRQESQENAEGHRLSTNEAVINQELLESIIDLSLEHQALEENQRPPPTAPSHPPSGLPAAPPADHEPLPGQVCCVCCDSPVQICFPQCGHANLCYNCAVLILNDRALCPICNTAVSVFSVLYT